MMIVLRRFAAVAKLWIVMQYSRTLHKGRKKFSELGPARQTVLCIQ